MGHLQGQPATTGASRHRGSFSANLQPPVCVQDRSPRGTRVFPSLQPELTSLYTWKTSLSRTIGQRRREPKEALSGRDGPHTSGFTAVMSKLSASRAEWQIFQALWARWSELHSLCWFLLRWGEVFSTSFKSAILALRPVGLQRSLGVCTLGT